ncbi:hypothetical protein B2J88_07910 [Rhodococcus sp. SRB_17]|nr:hypothetical protein [Rhodococcus sp. SRB_17]
MDMTTGIQLRLDGQDATLAAATVGHHNHPALIETALSELIKSGREFSADHVRDTVPADTRAWMTDHYNVLSSIIGRAAHRGRITHTGWCAPARKERHANPNRTWRGVPNAA